MQDRPNKLKQKPVCALLQLSPADRKSQAGIDACLSCNNRECFFAGELATKDNTLLYKGADSGGRR